MEWHSDSGSDRLFIGWCFYIHAMIHPITVQFRPGSLLPLIHCTIATRNLNATAQNPGDQPRTQINANAQYAVCRRRRL